MPENDGCAARIQDGLDPYIKSRDQVNYIRRILAAHIGECIQGSPLTSALALANTRDGEDTVKTDNTPANTIYREYLEALKENIAARKEFEAARDYAAPDPRTEASVAGTHTAADLNERVALLKLDQKRDRLYAVQETLDTLLEQPAADHEFLNTDRMFHGTPALPPVPRDVINTMVIEQSSSPLDIPGQISQLEKVVLRAKLLLKREEQQLQEAGQRVRRAPQPPSQAARLAALGATRDELIHWIETELGKASPEAQPGEDGDGSSERGPDTTDPAAIQAQLSGIKEKYALYVSARRVLLEMAASGPQYLPAPSRSIQSTKRTSYAPAAPPPPMDHLVAPYLASLVDTSANHKATVAYRTHMSALLHKTAQENSRHISKLAEDSHLLATFPQGEVTRHRSGTDSTSQISITRLVKPWVDAADAAKMATLETVAETVEGGQIALEGLMSTLHGIGKISGKNMLGGEDNAGEEDMWLGEETPRARKHTRKGSKAQSQSSTDPWSKVRGNLGLLGQDGP
ncbi:hypothetical protein CCM_07045 [Cordyceps militaris CM01]|uniref:Uncharacterized protein n=1 Tax=Cordyceps militaris (strain CM01) TaxID=983644 RepID=G3JLQ1_CORMM|nr:uncharacterized protein CCM_07045 [Cordyceps militaris CM01]EGX90625.1 hypothetical protein CCM_07045 [Cordyceps militaris CM01]